MRRCQIQRPSLAILASCVFACGPADEAVHGDPGTPLPGLTAAELAEFYAGAAVFNKVYTPEEGVGPLFNENQCSACHTDPAPGGTTKQEFVTKATRYEAGRCDALSQLGGENIAKKATPLLRAQGIEREVVPEAANGVGRFTTPFLFGLGLVQAIPDATILAGEDAGDADANGISGRAGRAPDGRVARFSRKAEVATLQDFIDSALRFEMGLTTPTKAEEETINGVPMPPATDPAPEPEADQRTLDLLTTFVTYLAPPAPSPGRSVAHRDTIAAGKTLFGEIGCTECHTPSMRTGPSPVKALSAKTVNLYSDLLLHDMGPSFADVCGNNAAPSEVRTELLMGLRHRSEYLHDGRTLDLNEAVLRHGGEAQRARNAYEGLPWLRQQFVLAFLRSL